jgi:hypothetical protein
LLWFVAHRAEEVHLGVAIHVARAMPFLGACVSVCVCVCVSAM